MKKILHWLDEYLEAVLCVIFMALMTVIIFAQVIARYVLGASLSWSEELGRYIFIWLIYLGTAYACKMKQHIKIDASLLMFPKKIRPYIVLLGDLLVVLLAVYILISGVELTQMEILYGKISPAMELPMAVVYLAPVTGMGLVIIRQLQVIFRRIADIGNKEEIEDTEEEREGK